MRRDPPPRRPPSTWSLSLSPAALPLLALGLLLSLLAGDAWGPLRVRTAGAEGLPAARAREAPSGEAPSGEGSAGEPVARGFEAPPGGRFPQDPGVAPAPGPAAGPGSPGGPQGPGPNAPVPQPTGPNPPGPGPTTPKPKPPPAPKVPGPCADGGRPLAAAEVERLLLAAAAALDADGMTLAVVDRAGRVLGLLRKRPADAGRDDRAVGLARTGAFFSNNQAPLSSRTVRFISGVHFPPGVARTPNAALYGIESTNRGCDLNVAFRPGREVPPAASVNGRRCDAFDATGCGTGPVTGKLPDLFDGHPRGGPAVHAPDPLPVDAGGLPIFRGPHLVGGIGIEGVPSSHAEFAAVTALTGNPDGLAFTPSPLPPPGVVVIDGIRLPLVRQIRRPAGTRPGAANGRFEIGPVDGGCVPAGYLVGPMGGGTLAAAEVERIVQQAVDGAGRTRAVIRLPPGERARMAIAVGDPSGNILALYRMSDATVFSIDVAVAKARNVAYFSARGLPGVAAGTAVTNRTISFGAQPLFPAGIDGTDPGPFFDLYRRDRANPCSQGDQPANPNQNGVVFFPGSVPLYRGMRLVGGLGISGDGVEQDDYVAFLGAQGFLPPEALWADRVFVRGVRLPFLKFPRNPER